MHIVNGGSHCFCNAGLLRRRKRRNPMLLLTTPPERYVVPKTPDTFKLFLSQGYISIDMNSTDSIPILIL